ncbi:hypothetical protein LXA43DRAFT_1063839 [Ganoderma leucocontextum]|nr:hypothetical protein LXA43DRAFT_1063839 [Ganoderma leucocontextum]
MHFAVLTTLALAFIGAAFANPTIASSADLGAPMEDDVSAPDTFPVIDLSSVDSETALANTTLNTLGDLRDGPAAQFGAATLLLCQSFNCRRCFGFDIGRLPHRVCLTANPGFFSVAISQPSNFGLPFGVFVGPRCSSFAQVPRVNTCFNIIGGPFQKVALSP